MMQVNQARLLIDKGIFVAKWLGEKRKEVSQLALPIGLAFTALPFVRICQSRNTKIYLYLYLNN